ncbi:unnamed protein product [Rodentolepis nana]|uniref:Uncharacterized protein n=1 Tax=Rodentolepis nana TaxID=102285 RepID=A0A0R3TRJ2_RODNA|nr:unnamed protein product [Rodentolepis nana]
MKQMLESRGHQAKQVYEWLSSLSTLSEGKEMKPFSYEDPNLKKNRRSRSFNFTTSGDNPLSAQGVEVGQRLLDTLTQREQNIMQKFASEMNDETLTGNFLRPFSLSDVSPDTNTISAEIPSSEKPSKGTETPPKPTIQKSSLPKDLAKVFTSIGQRNLLKEQKNAIAEKDL